jgi:hypothetical protein
MAMATKHDIITVDARLATVYKAASKTQQKKA